MEKRRKNQAEWIALLEEAVKMLPNRAQQAIYWAAANFDELKEVCDDPDITLEDIPDMLANAWKKEDYALFVLLCISKKLKESKENEES